MLLKYRSVIIIFGLIMNWIHKKHLVNLSLLFELLSCDVIQTVAVSYCKFRGGVIIASSDSCIL
jgi:hypothetical protein